MFVLQTFQKHNISNPLKTDLLFVLKLSYKGQFFLVGLPHYGLNVT